MWIEQFIQVSHSLLTPLIAILAIYIAWQQWKTNQQRLVWDCYDRRLAVYEEVKRILSIIQRDAVASRDDLLKFRTSASEADFLFGPEISEYIDEVYKRGVKLRYWDKKFKDYTQEQPKGYNHKKVLDEMHQELNWLNEQFEPAKNKFKKYLDVGK